MIHRMLVLLLSTLQLSLSVSCTEIFDKDITNEELNILSPPTILETDIVQVEFWWEEVKGASYIELQIVRERFSNVLQKQLDTLISSDLNSFKTTLFPGSFEWRIRAGNNSGTTEYIYGTIDIDSSFNLANVSPNLLFPSNQDTFNHTSIPLNWSTIYNADSYQVKIYKNDFGLNQINDVTQESPPFTLNIHQEGAYQWEVIAKNEMSNSLTSSRTFFVDTTSPSPPTNITPLNNANFDVNTMINFSWSPDPSEVSSMMHEIQITSDSSFSSIGFIKNTEAPSYYTDTLSIGVYFWRVRSTDKAGNIGSFSNINKFDVE